MDRFALPADFRKLVKESGAGERTLCLQIHDDLPCLVAFGLSRQLDFDAQIDREEQQAGGQFNRTARTSQLYGFRTIIFDDSGRFVLPPRWLEAAKITDRLYYQGAGPDFLIFNPDEVFKLGDEWRHMKISCEEELEKLSTGKGRK